MLATNNSYLKSPKAKGAWLVSLCAATTAMLISFCMIPAFSPTNDDFYIQESLAGAGGVSSEPVVYTTVVNPVLCLIVACAFSIVPSIPWWVITQLGLMLLALTLLGRTILVLVRTRCSTRIFQRGKTRELFELVALGALNYGMFAVFFSRLQFTQTANILVAISIFVTCCWRSDEADLRGGIWCRIILPIILYAFGFALRYQSGIIGLFFWGITILGTTRGIAGHKRQALCNIVKTFTPFLLAGASMVALAAADYIGDLLPNNPRIDSYVELISFIDYPHPSYDEDREMYDSVGWSRELTKLVDNWFMLDETLINGSAEELNEMNGGYALERFLDAPERAFQERTRDVAKSAPMAYIALAYCAAFVAIYLAKSKIDRVTIWIVIVTGIILTSYLILKGRLPERALYSILIPATAAFASIAARGESNINLRVHLCRHLALAIVIGCAAISPFLMAGTNTGRAAVALALFVGVLLVAISAVDREGHDKGEGVNVPQYDRRTRILRVSILGCCALVVMFPSIASVRSYGWNSQDYAIKRQEMDNTKDFINYIESNEDIVYIYSHAEITQQYVWLWDWPKNQTGWGGWRYAYSWFDDTMREIGLDGTPTSKDLLSDNVRFVTASEDTLSLLLSYLGQKFGPVEAIQTDSINNEISVYRFQLYDQQITNT